jgi:hypothetical protein
MVADYVAGLYHVQEGQLPTCHQHQPHLGDIRAVRALATLTRSVTGCFLKGHYPVIEYFRAVDTVPYLERQTCFWALMHNRENSLCFLLLTFGENVPTLIRFGLSLIYLLRVVDPD